jgi:hypothetical protein
MMGSCQRQDAAALAECCQSYAGNWVTR